MTRSYPAGPVGQGPEPRFLVAESATGVLTGVGVDNPLPVGTVVGSDATLAVAFSELTGAAATLDADTIVDGYDLVLQAGQGAGINVGDQIELFNTVTFMQADVLSIATDVLTVDTPINHVYASGSQILVTNNNMVVDGSVTPRIFSIAPEVGQRGRFSRIIITMRATANMDTGTFGPLAPLTRGVVLRLKLSNGEYRNLYNIKENSEFKSYSYDGSFDPNNGGGQRLFTTRLTWGGPDKHDSVIELENDGSVGNTELQMVIQDDLVAANFVSFLVIAEGREF